MKPRRLAPARRLSGEVAVPPDKSISHRAVMLGAIAGGRTLIRNILDCDDCNYTLRAFEEMGVKIRLDRGMAEIEGVGLRGLKRPTGPINAGESGTTIRMLAGILAGQNFEAVLTGDESLLKRPMDRVIEPLRMMGAGITGSDGPRPPLKIKGGSLRPIDFRTPVASAQVKSAVLLAGLYADGVTSVEEPFRSRDHTERMLAHFGADIKIEGLKVSVSGRSELSAKEIDVPGDISSASFFIVGATIVPGSRLVMKHVGINPTRAGILNIAKRMGARVEVKALKSSFEPVGDIEVASARTKGTVIEASEIPTVIDELPALFVLASVSNGKTIIKGAGELRVKETDRISSMTDNLRKMGARIDLAGNEIIIEGIASLRGAPVESRGDHRTCMAMSVASLAAKGESSIDDVGCVTKSYPDFFSAMDNAAK